MDERLKALLFPRSLCLGCDEPREIDAGAPLCDCCREELETLLIQGDVGVAIATELIQSVRQQAERQGARTADAVRDLLKQELVRLLSANRRPYLFSHR